MKAHTGFFELIIIVAFVVACVPLLMSLMLACNRSKFRYLDDKTVYSMGGTVEYVYSSDTGQMVPVNLAPIKLDKGGAQAIALIQDDYCPESGMLVNWKLTASHPDGTDSAGAVVPLTYAGQTNTLSITRGWRTKRADAFDSLHRLVSGPMNAVGADGPFYLVWDYEANCWMITHEFVNIFEVK